MSTSQILDDSQRVPPSSLISSPNKATVATLPTSTPPTPDSRASLRARLRLPPTIDANLIPQIQFTRQSFSQALAADQRTALQPDYQTSFQSANDIVKRLLPYHVWHVDDHELEWTLESCNGGVPKVSLTGKRRRGRQDSVDQSFPTSEQAYTLFARYSSLEGRTKKLRYRMTGGTSGLEGSLFCQESLYNIEKLAVEEERELLAAENEKLRQAKEKAIEMGVSWESLMRLGIGFSQAASSTLATTSMATGSASGNGSAGQTSNGSMGFSFQKSVGSIQGTPLGLRQPQVTTGSTYDGMSLDRSMPTTPLSASGKGSKPRGRPRKTRDQDGKIVSTPPNLKAAEQPKSSSSSKMVPSVTTPSKSSTPQSQIPPAPPRPPPTLATSSTPLQQPITPTPSVIPSHPIPLVLPLSTLARLSSLGIAPVPAPHLLPAISAQQAQSQNRTAGAVVSPLRIPPIIHSTAPRPAPPNQQEPALLMGITEAPIPRKAAASGDGMTNSTQQMLHVSVVLSKLSPSQLSGLATLMQSLQNTNGGDKASSSPSASSQQ